MKALTLKVNWLVWLTGVTSLSAKHTIAVLAEPEAQAARYWTVVTPPVWVMLGVTVAPLTRRRMVLVLTRTPTPPASGPGWECQPGCRFRSAIRRGSRGAR